MSDVRMSDAELLKYAVENAMIDAALVQEKIEMQKREELLNKHPYKIYQGKDGKWYTYLPDKKNGRILKKRTNKKDINYYSWKNIYTVYYVSTFTFIYSTIINRRVWYSRFSYYFSAAIYTSNIFNDRPGCI